MRLKISGSKNAASLYVIESTYIHGKHSSRVVEKLGTLKDLSEIHEDPIAWAKEYIAELNKKQAEERKENAKNEEVLLKLNSSVQLVKDQRQLFNGGYLFLQRIFYDLGLDKICNSISSSTKIEYDLTEILSRLVYGRILHPDSKLGTYEFSQRLIEPSTFEPHDIYRALSLLSKNMDFIQAELYKNTKKLGKRNDSVLYYDCTNYYFEIEQEDDFRKYGHAKSHKPNPIVEMGLFMDGDGIPLAFSMHPGNENEQLTLTPLEEKIEKDFEHSKFIVCTDAGLASKSNRLFNSTENKSFITTQSIKKLPKDLREWALNKDGWKILGCTDDEKSQVFNLDDLEKADNLDSNGKSKYYNVHFYKTKPYTDEIETVDDNGKKKKEYLSETFIITYSLKYRDYLGYIREGQIQRAQSLIDSCTNKEGKVTKKKAKKRYGQNDFHRFIESMKVDENGEVLSDLVYCLKQDLIDQEKQYDGYYGVATDLDENPEVIVGINKKRWEIEECFRIMKTEFSAEPVYLSREDRITAHFLVCILALIIYRYFEKKIFDNGYSFAINNMISELREMNFLAFSGNGYIPTYTRTEFTDCIHKLFGFRTDTQIIPTKNMKKIIQISKS